MWIHGGEQMAFFFRRKSTITNISRAWLANVQHWIERQAQSPFLNSDGVQVAQQSQLKAHSVVADVSIAAGLIQSLVSVASDDFSGEGGKRVFAQVFDELLGFGDFTALGAGLLGGGYVAQLAFECCLKGHAL